MASGMKLLSLSRPLIMLVIMVMHLIDPDVSRTGTALFAVSAAFFLASSSILVSYVTVPRQWRAVTLWVELAVITLLVWYSAARYNNDAMRALYTAWTVTLPLELDRRYWRLGFRLLALSYALATLPDWWHRPPQMAMFTAGIYGVMMLFFGSMGALLSTLRTEQARSATLLAEVTESRAALERAHRQLQDSAATQQEVAVIRERQRLAREIHDSVAHGLTALVVQTQAARKLMDRDPARALETVTRCEEMAREALQDTRRAVRALHPSGLEQASCVEALARLARDYGIATHMLITIRADDASRSMAPRPDLLEQLYRICQEALTNAHRHGKATTAELDLTLRHGVLALRISNDGESPTNLDPGVGLKSMRERVASINGSITFQPQAQGLLIHVLVPVTEQEVAG